MPTCSPPWGLSQGSASCNSFLPPTRKGLSWGEIQEELDIPNSTLSHHLEKLKAEGLVKVQRESTFLRYTANTEVLQELLRFLYAECCTRNKALRSEEIIQICK